MKRSAVNKKGGNVLPAVLGKGSSLKSLLLASLAGCIVIGAPSASAAELSDVDLSKKPLDTPTLDYLNQNNVTLPAGDDGVAAPVPPSAYTLTKVDAAGENTITKFEWDESTQSFNPVYYNVNLKQTEYGEGNKTHTVTLQNTPLKDVTINVHYEEPNISSVEYANEYKDIHIDLADTITPADDGKYAAGAAINNPKDAVIDSINNTIFENNTSTITVNDDSMYLDIYGGALYNEGTINNLEADFINNKVTSDNDNIGLYGGAIYNAGNIGNLVGNFIGNSTDGAVYNPAGGAIYNRGTIDSISGNFINNSAGNGLGGAIYNAGNVGSINANFIGNSAGDNWKGGAIYNNGSITSISGMFVDNRAGDSGGGAIYNEGGEIGNITGTFIGNSSSSDWGGDGGAIYNSSGELQNITADFISNSTDGNGGAIYNRGSIATELVYDVPTSQVLNVNIETYTIVNPETGEEFTYYDVNSSNWNYNDLPEIQEAIKNGYKIVVNNTSTEPYIPYDMEEYEEAMSYIQEDIADGYYFTGNPVNSFKPEDYAQLLGQGLISGNFIGNTADENGGAIYNGGEIGIISGDFIGNSAGGSGGAIYNLTSTEGGSIEYIIGDFIGNKAGENGGAIVNAVYLSEINGDFIGNHANSAGGAIYNTDADISGWGNSEGSIGIIKGEFIQNTSDSHGGAIANRGSAYISTIESDFIQNSAKTVGGAIYNGGLESTINKIKGDFLGNHVEGADVKGGAIYNTTGWDEYLGYVPGELGTISGTFAGNYAKSSSGDALGGAVYNEGHIDDYYNVSFIDNYAEALNGEAQGGAIYSKEDVNITADNYNSRFEGNYVKDGSGTDSNVIYMAPHVDTKTTYDGPVYKTTTATDLNLRAENNGTITINDKINGIGAVEYTEKTYWDYYAGNVTEYYDLDDNKLDSIPTEVTNYGVNFTGDETGVIYLNNNIEADDYEHPETGEITEGRADVTLSDTTLHFGVRDDVLNNNNFTVNSGTWNMVNNQTGVSALNSFTIKGDTNFVADVDLQNESMDRIESNSYGTHQGNLIVSGMNLLSDAPEGRDVTEIYFAQPGLKDNVLNGVSNGTGDLPDSNQTTFYTPIYKYNAVYDNRDDAGYFVFTKGDKIYTPTPGGDIPGGNPGGGGSITDTGNPSDAFNPAVLTTPVANQAASQAAMTEAFKYVFEHADAFTQLPATERMSYIRQNQYALSTDYNDNLGQLTPEFNNKAGWVRPYVTFENMHLKNGPKVDAITYGTLVGFDTDFQDLKRGWYGMTTGYVGYNGSQLSYSGVDGSTNGGLLGVTQTFYKGNFWTALTASAGASVGEAQTMYGSDDFTTLLAGVASKTGYNFEFKEGKFIIQPIMYISYT